MYGIGAKQADISVFELTVVLSRKQRDKVFYRDNQGKSLAEDVDCPEFLGDCLESIDQALSECCGLGLMSLIEWEQYPVPTGKPVRVKFFIEYRNEAAFALPLLKQILEFSENIPIIHSYRDVTDAEWAKIADVFEPIK